MLAGANKQELIMNIVIKIIFFTGIISVVACQPSKSKKELLVGEWTLDYMQISTTQDPEIITVKPSVEGGAIVGWQSKRRIVVFNPDGLYFDTLLRPKQAWHWSLLEDTLLSLKNLVMPESCC